MFNIFNNQDEDNLSPQEELANLKHFVMDDQNNILYSRLTDALDVLQVRSQMLLSLITIALTITGFSGPQIARSGELARVAIIVGLVLVLTSAFILMTGPLRMIWVTRIKYENHDQILLRLIRMRNKRTTRFYIASFALVVGLISYVTSVVAFLFSAVPAK